MNLTYSRLSNVPTTSQGRRFHGCVGAVSGTDIIVEGGFLETVVGALSIKKLRSIVIRWQTRVLFVDEKRLIE
ncbi:MAG: hypothetical protein Kow0074_13170 [Candidatus Zixiibacteriota bacterium]